MCGATVFILHICFQISGPNFSENVWGRTGHYEASPAKSLHSALRFGPPGGNATSHLTPWQRNTPKLPNCGPRLRATTLPRCRLSTHSHACRKNQNAVTCISSNASAKHLVCSPQYPRLRSTSLQSRSFSSNLLLDLPHWSLHCQFPSNLLLWSERSPRIFCFGFSVRSRIFCFGVNLCSRILCFGEHLRARILCFGEHCHSRILCFGVLSNTVHWNAPWHRMLCSGHHFFGALWGTLLTQNLPLRPITSSMKPLSSATQSLASFAPQMQDKCKPGTSSANVMSEWTLVTCTQNISDLNPCLLHTHTHAHTRCSNLWRENGR